MKSVIHWKDPSVFHSTKGELDYNIKQFKKHLDKCKNKKKINLVDVHIKRLELNDRDFFISQKDRKSYERFLNFLFYLDRMDNCSEHEIDNEHDEETD